MEDNGVIILVELISHRLFPNVTTLLLNSILLLLASSADNRITHIGIRALSLVLTGLFTTQGLQSLSIAENPLETEGARALSSIIRSNSKLQRLWANCRRGCSCST